MEIPTIRCPKCEEKTSFALWVRETGKEKLLENKLGDYPRCGAKDIDLSAVKGDPEEWQPFFKRLEESCLWRES
ncbi:hypothetical protein [Geoalkalibacter subterraneus]|uniref:Uncharacterized protein n=1 Tax=Geoalkalibacter subterraneus TaxID=483547 RepID=A0A0B5FX34_9BACT|nr:hypothetical protein [Geoalkalibacter subterraneus]AJF08161.1 hypothetical protein GSUB_16805 [Geoalkalibacter subterraneus]